MTTGTEVGQLVATAATVGLASAGVAAAFGKWVLSEVRDTKKEFSSKLDRHADRLDAACAKLDRLNGSVDENTRHRITTEASAPAHAAEIARMTLQMELLNNRMVGELIPLMNDMLHLRDTVASGSANRQQTTKQDTP